MTENIEGVISSINMNQVLVAILENEGSITIPTLKFLETSVENKELIIDYDETVPSFTFSLRDNNEQ
jgi:uncharacterized membrane protein YcaP (DUF421 family)